MAILILFFYSGATALIYELIWSKYLALLIGNTIQSQTIVLAVFMGGLAFGNRIFGRLADRVRNPLAMYGWIEIAVGLYALLFHFLYRAADGIFSFLGSSILDHPAVLLLLKGVLGTVLLLAPTILMGGTFPILSAWLQQRTSDAARLSARFYSTNSLGAVCGAGLAGFWLIASLGLFETMALAGLVNVIIGFTAIAIARARQTAVAAHKQTVEKSNSNSDQCQNSAVVFRRACLTVALTGAVAMGLEVLASRCLCLVFGASLQVFSIVLMAFILGISVGSAVIASPRWKDLRAETTAIFLLIASALLIGLVVSNLENLVGIYLDAQSGLNRNAMGYLFFQTLAAAVSIGVLSLPAAALGTVLPLCMRADFNISALLGERVGRLLTWNTLGAVGGSLLTGFALMPWLGLRRSFIALAEGLVVASILVAIRTRRALLVAAGVAAGLVVTVAAWHGDEGWRYVFSAGVFRQFEPDTSLAHILDRRKSIHLDFYEDAPDATVTVEHDLGVVPDLALRIDGKIDASAKWDSSTQLLLADLPLMMKPEARDVFCFGLGSGITAGAALDFPLEHLTVAENCGPVLRAARLFEAWNNGVLTNGRARIYEEDARTVLKLSQTKYDVIIAEPSNPWMSGVASLFTREFYQLAASRLKPGGLMTQWFHTYEMDDGTVDVVLRTFESVFPEMEIWDVEQGDIVILGSNQPWRSDTEVYRRALALEKVRAGLASVGLDSPEAILARRMASQRTAFAIAKPGPLQTDDLPILEYAAPRAFYIHLRDRGVFRLHSFDERTWQMDLASESVNNDLAQLDQRALNIVFDGSHDSANPDLQLYLNDRYAEFIGHSKVKPLIIGDRAMPCSLQGTNKTFAISTPPSAATNALTRQLAMAEYVLRTNPAQQLDAIASIDNALHSVVNYNASQADWSPAYYADLGVKASLRASNPARARAILLQGLKLEPGSDQLHYLSRILIHEKILSLADLSSIGTK